MARTGVICFATTLLVSIMQVAPAKATTNKTAAVSIVVENARPTGMYTALVNGHSVKAPINLLDKLADLYGELGREAPVSIIVHDSVPIGRVTDLLGMTSKVGFIHVQCYYFKSGRLFMSPIIFGTGVPFSTNPRN